MNARAAFVGIILALAATAAYKTIPSVYNARKVAQLAGRHVYDEKADSIAIEEAALAQARQRHQRVLAILGGNWCHWCLALDELMNTDDEIRGYIAGHFVLLHVDVDTAAVLDRAWGTPSQRGVPVLVFLDPDGHVAHVQDSVSLESLGGRLLRHDRDRVLQALHEWS